MRNRNYLVLFTQVFFALNGIIMMLNGVWMMLSATHWFNNIPADMIATGNPNNHLIHDVGVAYFVFGFGLIWCAMNLERCRPVYLGVTMFMVGHALGHVVEIFGGYLPTSHWLIDFPLVFLPAILFFIIALPPVWKRLTTLQ